MEQVIITTGKSVNLPGPVRHGSGPSTQKRLGRWFHQLTAAIPPAAPTPTAEVRHTPPDKVRSASNAYGGSAYITRKGRERRLATNAYGGSATHTAGQGTTASNAYE